MSARYGNLDEWRGVPRLPRRVLPVRDVSDTVRVFLNHAVVREHPPKSYNHAGSQTLVVIEPNGDTYTYMKGEWHGAGAGVICGFVDPDSTCVNCHGVKE